MVEAFLGVGALLRCDSVVEVLEPLLSDAEDVEVALLLMKLLCEVEVIGLNGAKPVFGRLETAPKACVVILKALDRASEGRHDLGEMVAELNDGSLAGVHGDDRRGFIHAPA